MQQPPPAQPGMREDEVDTPALLVDLDAFESNLDTMARMLAPTGVKLRAHAKTHKSPVIAHQQIARGAVGQCVQKVAEAEVLAWAGVKDILVSNEVVGASKLARLAALTRIARIAICADHAEQVDAIGRAAAEANVKLTVLVEMGMGGRCGVEPGEPVLALAQRIAASPHLTFGGLQAYNGGAQHKRQFDERRAKIDATVVAARRSIDLLASHGLACPIVGGGGTGTFHFEAASGVYTEVQAGSYVFMDADYARNFDASGAHQSPFRQALFVLATIMSARSGVAVLDAGHKAIAVDSGMPLVWERPGLVYTESSDEHGRLDYDAANVPAPRLGEKLRLVPGHCDPTVDHHDWYVGIRRGRVECLWPVAARGAFN